MNLLIAILIGVTGFLVLRHVIRLEEEIQLIKILNANADILRKALEDMERKRATEVKEMTSSIVFGAPKRGRGCPRKVRDEV